MKRSDLGESKLTPNFIGSWIIDYSLCDEIIEYYEKNKQKQSQGVTSGGMDLAIKDRRDITLTPQELNLPENIKYKIYFKSLFECYKDYNLQWPFLSEIVNISNQNTHS